MYRSRTVLFLFLMFVFPCGATEPGCTECTSSQPETSSLLQAKVSVNSAMHSRAIEVATAMKAIHQEPLLGLTLLKDFATNAIGMDMALDNSTSGVLHNINKSLEAEIIKQIIDDHALDDNAIIKEVNDGVASCTRRFTQDKESDANEGLKAKGLGADHRSLRESLKLARANRTDQCTKMKNIVTGVPSYPSTSPTPPADDQALANSQVVESYRQQLERALAALTPFDDQKKSCIETIVVQEKDHSASVAKQTVFESSMCTWRVASMQSCFSYEECYQTLQDTLDSEDHWLLARVQHRKLEFETVRRIQCILKVLVVDEKSTTVVQRKQMLTGCQTKTWNVSHLNITMPKLPEKQPCNLSPVATYPGTADFHDSWHKDNDGMDYPDLQAVTPCSIPDKLKHIKDTTSQGWKLAANINPCDGHNMGYGGPWATNSDVGACATALSKDRIDSNVWKLPVGYVAIARHVGGVCEMAKTWKLKENTKSLHDYFSSYPGRLFVTGDGGQGDQAIHEDVPSSATGLNEDPIFGAKGGLVFNWYYSNNGARIAVPGGYKNPYSLPSAVENNDDVHGLGNEFGASTQAGGGSSQWWHDVAQLSPDCHGNVCKVVGTDRGTALSARDCWGGVQYAIYVSEDATMLGCQGRSLAEEV